MTYNRIYTIMVRFKKNRFILTQYIFPYHPFRIRIRPFPYRQFSLIGCSYHRSFMPHSFQYRLQRIRLKYPSIISMERQCQYSNSHNLNPLTIYSSNFSFSPAKYSHEFSVTTFHHSRFTASISSSIPQSP